MAAPDWYTINNVDELDTPALVVYPDRVKYNIGLVKTMIDDVLRLRPHVKTHKSPDVSLLMIKAGITKFKCATIAEAEMLGMAKAPDVLLAYQATGPKLSRFVQLIKAYPQTAFSCLVDNEKTAKAIADQATEQNITIPVYIDLNIGMNRTGIVPAQALALYEACAGLVGIQVLGLHAYDGHIHDADYNARQQRSDDSIKPVLKLADDIAATGYSKPVIIAGGSPTFPILAKRPGLECSPGTFAYWDRGYQLAFPEQQFQTAALIIARVISLPYEGKICIDVGHKSVSAENELSKRIYFLNAPNLVFNSQSEEHLVADAGKGHQYKVGDILYGLPYHICPTIALYERAITVENKLVTEEWKNIARDRKITI
ncbi:D-TA family PLP-dependent enzyme [Mucilaginibacter sp. AK015]|uniref:D-TA family PLP-dependent enzyme n=1 Tax=Mucilaginibacter sp. AK015 TaxID=2723072 RepID=UPI00161CCFE2|nr:D-TA family PLP-dependent enzyme [Mucilaginibacter sp. AK015]MBB5394273.1 D-serine deaminase-like pyridoxal phosphate-dependent protein [Mucilaginibacter sp. AK015]